MESIHLFFKEVTTELLYNIVYDHDGIDYRELSEIFEGKTGHRPMDFFGFGNETGQGWLNFIKGIPGVQGRMKISIVSDQYSNSEDEYSNYKHSKDGHVYKIFNKTYLYSAGSVTVAEYREMILINCCEMIDNVDDLSHCKDENGNAPLHYIAALPGLTYDCDTLVKYLLQAGVDPLATNDDGKTFLHTIFGRFSAENDDDDELRFMNTRVPKTQWFMEDRVDLLELLSQNLSSTYTALLAKAQDQDGNTVLHECLLSTTVEEFTEEEKICKNLLQFGACLTIPNKSNEVPLHYAYTPQLFKIFRRNGAVCRIRNDRDESPVLFILKKSVDLAFAQTSAASELVDQAFVKTTLTKSVSGAIKLLKNLKSIVSQNEDAKKTVWIPDVKGNIAVSVLLVAIRIGSYGLLSWSTELCSVMVELLSESLSNASQRNMKWESEKGQSFLHVLLDMSDDNEHTINREEYICQSVEMLINHAADVNAVDLQGRSPLDITEKYRNKLPLLYKKCSELLTRHGATGQHDAQNNSSSSSATNSLASIYRRFINSSTCNETRKLRSCPKRHLSNAERLTDSRTQVTVVGKYRYSSQNLIGSGGFSSIFVAIKDENIDNESGRIQCRAFALKRIEKARMNSKDIKREITTLMSISDKCEHIIKYHESFEDDNFQYLSLDLMDGDLREFVNNDLREFVNVNNNNLATGVQITKELVNGLVFLHKENFIHRDLKPGNILYTTDPSLHFKIADFGLAKNMAGSSVMSSTGGNAVAMAAGTRCWMAPELVSMKTRDHTEQSDVFSLGLVLHYLLTLGKHPFGIEGEPAHVIERKIVEISPNLDQVLRPEAISFLHSILAKNPSKRPPAAYLNQHPFIWSDRKKIEFLKAVGDQPEAANPAEHPNSELEQSLEITNTGKQIKIVTWDRSIAKIYQEMTRAWKQKKYRTDKVIDLIRFIRNAYAHKQERSLQSQQYLDGNIFTRIFPSLVLDVLGVVQRLDFDENRSNIHEALSLST